MKRLTPLLASLWIVMLAGSLAACSASGGQVKNLLANPQIGLDDLTSYANTLTVSFKGSRDGQTVDQTDTFSESVWPQLGARFTTIDTFDDAGQPLYVLAGDVGEAHYEQTGREAPCSVWWGETVEGPPVFRVTSLMMPVGAAQLAGEETVQGIATKHYTFDGASLGLPQDAQAGGEAWIAVQGGFLVKYSLQITASASYFGEGVQGTREFAYILNEIEANPQVVYPDGCQPVLADVPAMDDAAEVIRLPGVLDYYSDSATDAITAFYANYFEAQGWVKASEIAPQPEQALVIFVNPGPIDVAFLSVAAEGGSNSVNISVLTQETTAPAASGDAGEQPPAMSQQQMAVRVIESLSLLLALEGEPVLPSYHLEATQQTPVWSGDAIRTQEEVLTADVEGSSLHFIDRLSVAGGAPSITEAYNIGGQEYTLQNGVAVPGYGMATLTWTLWLLDPTSIISAGATGTALTGSEPVDGRPADVYSILGTGLDTSAIIGMAGIGLPVTSAQGTVWVDQASGALLKAEIDFTVDVLDDNRASRGEGAGRLEISVTGVGTVSVVLPGS